MAVYEFQAKDKTSPCVACQFVLAHSDTIFPASAKQLLDQLFPGHCLCSGDFVKNRTQRAHPQRIVIRDGKVMLKWLDTV